MRPPYNLCDYHLQLQHDKLHVLLKTATSRVFSKEYQLYNLYIKPRKLHKQFIRELKLREMSTCDSRLRRIYYISGLMFSVYQSIRLVNENCEECNKRKYRSNK